MSDSDPETTVDLETDSASTDGILNTSRRKFLAAGTATWTSVALAGCGAFGGDDSDGEEEETPRFVVTDEVLAGSDGIPEGASGFVTSGLPQRTFVPGMTAIFKIGVWDPETGDIVSDEALEEARVDLDRDVEVDLGFSRDEREWSGDWMIPAEAETGTVGYDVVVSNGAEFTNVGISESELEIIDFEPAANYVVTTSTYSTEDTGGGYVQSCLPQHNFTPGMTVGFDIGIFDGGSGDLVGPDVVEEATIELETGDTLELEWDEDPQLWNATWTIPEGTDPGTLTYEIQVTNGAEFHVAGARGKHSVEEDSIEIVEATGTGDGEGLDYVMTAGTYTTEEVGGGFTQSCQPLHNFTPGMKVGFEIGIFNADTGEPVGEADVNGVIVELETGVTVELGAPALGEDEKLWRGTWDIPSDQETGTITYEVQVSDGEDDFHLIGYDAYHAIGEESIRVIEV